ncbi:MAG TPA: DUF262 domain-containing protein [Polyangiaceae bacterium]|nr:DUF262 domain-containing protein [Polyangiaceae bacterium]
MAIDNGEKTDMKGIPSDNDWLAGVADELDDPEKDSDFAVQEYDLISAPNDFNVKTIVDSIRSGRFEIPTFQRNYVWDIRRASKLIESIVMGLPVPQIFLYEKARNKLAIIDGQQRLMSIFYYTQKRFPRIDKRAELRRIFDENGKIPAETLDDDKYFQDFTLELPTKLPNQTNRLHGLSYDSLGDDRDTFDYRTIRCVVVKQNAPKDDDSSVYEIFYRLNAGGINLTPQEIRASIYHSKFFDMLHRLNVNEEWRAIIGVPEPDLHMRDMEIILRGFAMLIDGENYQPSMTRFLNNFSKSMRSAPPERLVKMERIFYDFVELAKGLKTGPFSTQTRQLSVSVFEAAFAASCRDAWMSNSKPRPLTDQAMTSLKTDPNFLADASAKSTNKGRVTRRLARARELLFK